MTTHATKGQLSFLVFDEVGSWLSVGFSSSMFLFIACDKTAPAQVRPRLLMTLAALDCFAAAAFGVQHYPAVENSYQASHDKWGLSSILNVLGVFFLWSSFTWYSTSTLLFRPTFIYFPSSFRLGRVASYSTPTLLFRPTFLPTATKSFFVKSSTTHLLLW